MYTTPTKRTHPAIGQKPLHGVEQLLGEGSWLRRLVSGKKGISFDKEEDIGCHIKLQPTYHVCSSFLMYVKWG